MVEMWPSTPGSKQQKLLVFFKGLALFTNIRDEDLVSFADAATVKNYKSGKCLYLEGDRAEFFYIILNGWVKLSHTTTNSKRVALAMVTAGSIIGEKALFEEGRHTNSAQVTEHAQILSIPLHLLEEQLRVNNALAFNMLTSMMQYKRQHETKLEQHVLYSAPRRIGAFLLGLCPDPERKTGITLILPYDRKLVASTLRMSGATFSRALKILVEETGIKITGTRMTIGSVKRLLTFVNCSDSPLFTTKDSF